ncbi:MAG: hypothetical protein U0998_07395 [Moraxellaceae bacterium]|nr:hypothetical protein [Moraxellaceae bacterium]MDZ4387017.1 hypothetical protein [Moraxellaceae bacterium]
MRIVNKSGFMTLLIAAVALTACQSRSVVSTQEPAVQVYRSAQALQCEPSSGVSLAQAEAELANAGVAARCGQVAHDGAMRIQMCGADSGRIYLFRITANQLAAAKALGYETAETLESLPPSYCDEVTEPVPTEGISL